MAKSHYRGHEIEFIGGRWVFAKTGLSVAQTHQEMPCGCCGRYATDKGHDACIADLPWVVNACCGHGRKHGDFVPYLQFENGEAVYKEPADKLMEWLVPYRAGVCSGD